MHYLVILSMRKSYNSDFEQKEETMLGLIGNALKDAGVGIILNLAGNSLVGTLTGAGIALCLNPVVIAGAIAIGLSAGQILRMVM
jgi:hypothetical protein